MAVVSHSSTPRSLSNDIRVKAQSSFGKRLPNETSVGTTGSNLIGLDDRISSGEEARSTGLELHAVDDELHCKSVSVLGDKRSGLAKGVKRLLGRLGVVIVRLRRVGRREESGRKAILLDKSLRNNKEEFGPDLSDGVNTPVSGLS